MTRTTSRLTAVLSLSLLAVPALLSTPAAAARATAPALKAVTAAEAPAAGTEVLARRKPASKGPFCASGPRRAWRSRNSRPWRRL